MKPRELMHRPPVLIVGCSRSGTTLLRLMLTAHPNVSISSEGAHIYQIARNFSAYGGASDITGHMHTLHAELDPWLEKVEFISRPSVDDLLDWVRTCGASLRSLITFYGTWEARALGKHRLIWWGDNAPYHVNHLALFNTLFPEMRVLLMIRDPRDACASGKEDLSWGPGNGNFENRVVEWEKALLHGLLAQSMLGPARFRMVKYEELVSEPRRVLEEIARFLDVTYTDEMLAYYESPAATRIAAQAHHRNVLKPVFATSIGRYRQILTNDEIDVVERRLFASMFQLGYLSYPEYRRALYTNTGIEPEAE